jgi:SAM-dependent methyltransferase
VSEPHPLAERLIERLQSVPHSRILDFASGSGRNREALERAGFAVVAIDDRTAVSSTPFAGITQRFTAAISTHGLLHGVPSTIAANVRSIAECLEPGGLLYATFGSTHDARFGSGRRLDASTFAPTDGDERGVAHAYFDREALSALLEPYFEIASLDESGVDAIAGKWAHRGRALTGAAHWFVIARKR